jgi:hypothetical protein
VNTRRNIRKTTSRSVIQIIISDILVARITFDLKHIWAFAVTVAITSTSSEISALF